ncbi:MAG: hypothetical protein HWN79_10815 [Candidatus Lokiarchaeota archaeon]|nr:hypothetical protein [Candidatus Lokiarchaeota archaeon]
MNTRNFQIFLEENKIDPIQIRNFLSKLDDYENYLAKDNLNLDSVNPNKLAEYTEHLVSIDKDSVLDFLRAILSYADYSKRYEFITETIDIVESYNAMDTMFSRIAEFHGEQTRDEIFKDLIIPPVGVHPEKKPKFTKKVMKRMEDNLGKESTIALLSPCLHGRPPDDIEGDKTILSELGIDGFLEKKHQDLIKRLKSHRDDGTLEFAQSIDDEVIDFVRNNQEFGAGVRKGNFIYISKIPYQTKKYLTIEDNNMKKYYLCYCPWVRGALKEGTDDELSNSFCYCSAGWYKLYWDQIFEQPVKVKPVKSALNNDMECTFTVHIPDNIISKNS